MKKPVIYKNLRDSVLIRQNKNSSKKNSHQFDVNYVLTELKAKKPDFFLEESTIKNFFVKNHLGKVINGKRKLTLKELNFALKKLLLIKPRKKWWE